MSDSVCSRCNEPWCHECEGSGTIRGWVYDALEGWIWDPFQGDPMPCPNCEGQPHNRKWCNANRLIAFLNSELAEALEENNRLKEALAKQGKRR